MTKADQSVRWSKRERGLLYHHESCKPTSMLIAHVFEGIQMIDMYGGRTELGARVHRPQSNDQRTFCQELEARGYDITTLKFSIHKKAKMP